MRLQLTDSGTWWWKDKILFEMLVDIGRLFHLVALYCILGKQCLLFWVIYFPDERNVKHTIYLVADIRKISKHAV